jgi:hypothetical protein
VGATTACNKTFAACTTNARTQSFDGVTTITVALQQSTQQGPGAQPPPNYGGGYNGGQNRGPLFNTP